MSIKKNDEQFAYLDQLRTSKLEKIIRADVKSSHTLNDEVIFCILEVLTERAEEGPSREVFEEKRLWNDIQTIYHVPEGRGRTLYPEGDENNEEQ